MITSDKNNIIIPVAPGRTIVFASTKQFSESGDLAPLYSSLEIILTALLIQRRNLAIPQAIEDLISTEDFDAESNPVKIIDITYDAKSNKATLSLLINDKRFEYTFNTQSGEFKKLCEQIKTQKEQENQSRFFSVLLTEHTGSKHEITRIGSVLANLSYSENLIEKVSKSVFGNKAQKDSEKEFQFVDSLTYGRLQQRYTSQSPVSKTVKTINDNPAIRGVWGNTDFLKRKKALIDRIDAYLSERKSTKKGFFNFSMIDEKRARIGELRKILIKSNMPESLKLRMRNTFKRKRIPKYALSIRIFGLQISIPFFASKSFSQFHAIYKEAENFSNSNSNASVPQTQNIGRSQSAKISNIIKEQKKKVEAFNENKTALLNELDDHYSSNQNNYRANHTIIRLQQSLSKELSAVKASNDFIDLQLKRSDNDSSLESQTSVAEIELNKANAKLNEIKEKEKALDSRHKGNIFYHILSLCNLPLVSSKSNPPLAHVDSYFINHDSKLEEIYNRQAKIKQTRLDLVKLFKITSLNSRLEFLNDKLTQLKEMITTLPSIELSKEEYNTTLKKLSDSQYSIERRIKEIELIQSKQSELNKELDVLDKEISKLNQYEKLLKKQTSLNEQNVLVNMALTEKQYLLDIDMEDFGLDFPVPVAEHNTEICRDGGELISQMIEGKSYNPIPDNKLRSVDSINETYPKKGMAKAIKKLSTNILLQLVNYANGSITDTQTYSLPRIIENLQRFVSYKAFYTNTETHLDDKQVYFDCYAKIVMQLMIIANAAKQYLDSHTYEEDAIKLTELLKSVYNLSVQFLPKDLHIPLPRASKEAMLIQDNAVTLGGMKGYLDLATDALGHYDNSALGQLSRQGRQTITFVAQAGQNFVDGTRKRLSSLPAAFFSLSQNALLANNNSDNKGESHNNNSSPSEYKL